VTDVAGILLAAGESRRMGYPKPLLQIDGVTFVEKVAMTMLQLVSPLVIVVGAHRDRVLPAIPLHDRIVIVENLGYSRGQLSSIKAGLIAVMPKAHAVVIHLADHPLVREDSFARVLDSYRTSHSPIVIARQGRQRGHPVLFDRSVFPELLAAPEEEGARFVVNRDPGRVRYVDVDDPGVNLDLDTPADLHRAGLRLPAQ
jgi:molybdenum cofactor cytidylyltransferase